VQDCNIPFKILLGLLKYPFLEVDEVKGVMIVDLLGFKPLNVKRKMVGYFLAVEDSVDHMTTK
jgi:hypothetical protein